ncbi:hypothetical protein SteCoe_12298 [Stentor coeruleus]|uniref:Uncharacterized protein n=1 Tax=Stentor coeruleus TaxID=5963 RepID=A0A1R2CB45_9CILI|nr:hypothetical protein SteCoe_12298 [Stentor coeruleus]
MQIPHIKESNKQFFHKKYPFKASYSPNIAKHMSFNNMLRSQDLILEKKKLNEENWRLKHIFDSLSEENEKLRLKLLQYPDCSNKSSQKTLKIVNSCNEIDKIHENIDKTRLEIDLITTENHEIRKKIFKASEKLHSNLLKSEETNLIIRPSLNTTKPQTSLKTQTLLALNSEVYNLNVVLKVLHEKNVLLNQSAEDEKQKLLLLTTKFPNPTSFSIQKLESFNIFPTSRVLKIAILPHTSLAPKETIIDKNEKYLRRESFKNDSLKMSRFLRFATNEVVGIKKTPKELLDNMPDSYKNVWNYECFMKYLDMTGIRFAKNEVEFGFEYLNNQQGMSLRKFVGMLEDCAREMYTDKSSDISGSIYDNGSGISIQDHES